MKSLVICILILFTCLIGISQNRHTIDSLKQLLANATQDTCRILYWVDLSFEYRNLNPDTSILYGNQALSLAQKINFLRGGARAYHTLGGTYRVIGELPKAIEFTFKGLQVAEENDFPHETSRCMNLVAIIFMALDDYKQAREFLEQAFEANKRTTDSLDKIKWNKTILANLGVLYRDLKILDSAKYYFEKSLSLGTDMDNENAYALSNLGRIEFLKGNHQTGIDDAHKAIQFGIQNTDYRLLGYAYNNLAKDFKEISLNDSAIHYSQLGLTFS